MPKNEAKDTPKPAEERVKTIAELAAQPDIDLPERSTVSSMEMVGKTIIINAFRLRPSKLGGSGYYEIEVMHDGEIFVMTSGATMVMLKLEALKDHLPFECMVVQKGNSIDLQ